MLSRYLLKICFVIICGTSLPIQGRRQGRIVGGDILNIEEAPFNVALEYLTRQICGGAVLTKDWMVTAAHCFGRMFLSSQALVRSGSGERLQGGVEHSLRTYIKHPNFVLHVNDYDVALIMVWPPFTYSSVVSPIRIPDYYPKPDDSSMVTVYGWGYTQESGDPSEYLRYVTLPMFPHTECVNLYSNILNVTSQMLCAGFRDGGRDACVLDSGGPLVWDKALHGLVSWGWGCARSMHPGVFTDVSSPSVRDWILSVIQA